MFDHTIGSHVRTLVPLEDYDGTILPVRSEGTVEAIRDNIMEVRFGDRIMTVFRTECWPLVPQTASEPR